MKKLIIAAVILISTTVQMFAGPIVTVTMEFGHRDANRVCIPRGICDITIGVSAKITAQIDDNTGSLKMTFMKTASSQDLYNDHFANGIFEVPVNYNLSTDICNKLGVSKFNILAGRYKVIELSDKYVITFSPNSVSTMSK